MTSKLLSALHRCFTSPWVCAVAALLAPWLLCAATYLLFSIADYPAADR